MPRVVQPGFWNFGISFEVLLASMQLLWIFRKECICDHIKMFQVDSGEFHKDLRINLYLIRVNLNL